MQKKLDRTLGLYSAITISVGTMIGSAIFVLAGTSYEVAGPSASLAVFLAGVGAFFTAFSFAELVTIIPRAGGGYAYARDATNNGVLAFITGWGFWLAYAMSCGLFAIGFGNFLNYFFPFIPVQIGAYALIVYVIYTNIKGVENAGNLQNVITTGLIILLAGYITAGVFNINLSHQRPFFPQGLSGTFTAVGFLYITYIGYGLVTTASEEVINPEKTIPKAIIISLIIVTFIKTAVFFIGSSILPIEELIPSATSTPLTNTAVVMAGQLGGYLFAFTGILATISSINTAMMAASRTSFAMSRDNHLPAVFRNINAKTRTPIISVLTAGLIVTISTSLRSLEDISTVTSLFALTGYSMVNVALMIFRRKLPDTKRAFKVPFFPLTPIAGIAVNVFLVVQLMLSNYLALSIALGISLLGILYYYLLLPKLSKAHSLVSVGAVPAVLMNKQVFDKAYRVLIPVASPATVEDLISFGISIANSYKGMILPVHVIEVPEVIPLDSEDTSHVEQSSKYKTIINAVCRIAKKKDVSCDPLLILGRDVFRSLKKTVSDTGASFVLMGWHASGLAKRMTGSLTHKAMEHFPAEIGIYKKGSNRRIKKILYPYGGGLHSQETAQIVKRIAESTQAEVTFLRVVETGTPMNEHEKIHAVMQAGLELLGVKGHVRVVEHYSIVKAIVTASAKHDIVVMGASAGWGLGGQITGTRTDKIMKKISCSGLIIRKYLPLLQRKGIRNIFRKIKRFMLD